MRETHGERDSEGDIGGEGGAGVLVMCSDPQSEVRKPHTAAPSPPHPGRVKLSR